MSKAFLVAGFNNWGKTKIINTLFNTTRYDKGKKYSINNVNKKFIVESHSNDDNVGLKNYIDSLNKKYDTISPSTVDLFSALCPSREPNNDSAIILNHQFFQQNFSDIYLFYLEYKWDYHSKLIIEQIIEYYNQNYKGRVQLHHIVINADNGLLGTVNDKARLAAKINQIITELQSIP